MTLGFFDMRAKVQATKVEQLSTSELKIVRECTVSRVKNNLINTRKYSLSLYLKVIIYNI